MTINNAALDLLHAIEFKPQLPLEDALVSTGTKIRSARYHLKALIEQNIIRGHVAYIDTNKLGLTSYGIYFSLIDASKTSQDALLKELCQISGVSWIASLGGHYQYVVNIRARHISEVVLILDQISSKFPSFEISNSIAIRSKMFLFSRSNGSRRRVPEICIDGTPASLNLSETDERVLEGLSKVNHLSFRQRALKVGVAEATFLRRKRKLEELGVIKGYLYDVNTSLIGKQAFRILVGLKRPVTKHHDTLYDFVRRTPQARKLVECVGAWAAEIEIEVDDLKEAFTLRNQLRELLGSEVDSLNMVPLFEHIYYRSFL